MAKRTPFEIQYAAEVMEHLDWIPEKYHSLIWKTILEQLSFEPMTETRNRKFLTPPGVPGTTWELRLGPGNRFRVLYNVFVEERCVMVAGIGVKEGSQLFVGGEEQ
jgi:hypothetical protein